MAVISAVVGIFSRDRSHSKAKMKNFKKASPYFFDFRTGSARKRGPKSDEISILKHYNEITNNPKTAVLRDLHLLFLVEVS